MQRLTLLGLALFLCGLFSTPASAIKPFQDAWYDQYLADNDNTEYVDLVKKDAKCWLCHKRKNRKNRNPYGAQLQKLITKKDGKETEKILEALKTVGEMHIDPKDENSPTFAQLIADGKLPGGDVEEAKQEPDKKD